MLNGVLENIDFETAGRLLIRWFTAALDTLIGFITTPGLWKNVAKAIGDFLKGALDEAREWLAQQDFVYIAQTLSDGILGVLKRIQQEIHDHDLVRLNPRWDITSYDALELWPNTPRNILEFWNYIAYAFTKKRISYPEFMNVVTDLEKVQRRISEWEREKEVGTWYDRIQSVNERPPQPPRHPMYMRLVPLYR